MQAALACSNQSDTAEVQHRLLCMLWHLARKPMESKWNPTDGMAAVAVHQPEPGTAWSETEKMHRSAG